MQVGKNDAINDPRSINTRVFLLIKSGRFITSWTRINPGAKMLCSLCNMLGKKGDVCIVMATSMIGTTEHALCWPAVHRGALLSLHRVVSLSVFPPKSQCCGTSERALASLSHWYSVMPAPCWTPYIGLQRQDTVCVLWRDPTNTEEKDIIVWIWATCSVCMCLFLWMY